MAGMDTDAEAAAARGVPTGSTGPSDEVRLLRQRALLELARSDKTDLTATLHAVTEAAAAVVDVARASIWRLDDGRRLLTCLDLFMAEDGEHTLEARLVASDYPGYFRALLQARAIAAMDARSDPRTAEFRQGYLEPRGITSMLDVPIWSDGSLYGSLCLEQVGPPRRWTPEEVDFAGNLADVVSLALSAAEHARSEQRWEAIFQAMTESVAVVGRDGDVVAMNASARAFFSQAGGGRTLAERKEQLAFFTLSGQPLPQERWPGPRTLRGERIQGEIAEVHVRASGEHRFLRMSTTPLYEAGRIAGGLMVFSDVTDEMNFERLKRDFLAELAHELKTPVTITQLSAQHVAAAPGLPASLRPRLEAILRAAGRMGRLVDDIVEISSIMLGDLVLERQPVELGELVRSRVAGAAHGAQSGRLRVETGEPVYVLADPGRLAHALRHLVDNALRYAPQGEVWVRVQRAGQGAEVCVQDQGIGIPLAQQPHLFELFYRAHAGTPHDVGGMGIGLFLCRELLRLHGGHVRVHSVEGEGSTFCAWLPGEPLH